MKTTEKRIRAKDKVGTTKYSNLHAWIVKNYGNAPFCLFDDAHSGKFEWANVTGIYNEDMDNYIPLCVSCHRKMDYTEEDKERLRKACQGKPSFRRKAVIQKDKADGQVIEKYHSITEASRKTGVILTAISNNLGKRSGSAGGFIWEEGV